MSGSWRTLIVALALAAGCGKEAAGPPARGVPFTDSLYGSVVVRITDKQTDGYSGPGIQNEYARADAWNCDSTRLVLRGNDGVFYLYDARTCALVRSLGHLSGGRELEPRWYSADPDRFYFLAGPALASYRVSTNQADTVHDFRAEFPLCSFVTTGVEGDASSDRRYWCFMVQDSVPNLLAACVYDRDLDSVVGRKTSFPDAVNHVTMDVSGTHALIAYDSATFQAFRRDFSHMVQMPVGAVGHADMALTAGGEDVIVYQNVATDSISMAVLETGVETGLVPIPFDVNPDIGLHISGNCDLVPGWVLISTYGAQDPPSGSSHSWMDTLLFMLELKPSPRVVKLAQTHCYTGTAPRSNYFAEAYASINRAGTRVVYGSNWGVYSPEDYTEAYEARLPERLYDAYKACLSHH